MLWGEGGRPIRFIIAGGWNTVFGVLTYAGLYYGTRPAAGPRPAHYLSVLIVSSVVAVTQAYLCYKYFVFKTSGNFVREFLRFSMVYAVTFAFNLVFLPFLVTFVGMAPVAAQALIVAISAVASYVGHSRLSFNAGGMGLVQDALTGSGVSEEIKGG
jgi:putative flippase GtrA